MHQVPESVPEDRPLSAEEYRLAHWMLEHAEPSAREFLPQLDRASVISRCGCGCASIDFAIDDRPAPSGAIRVIADFLFGPLDDPGEAFLFERNGQLAGLEVYKFIGDGPDHVPTPEMLRALDDDCKK